MLTRKDIEQYEEEYLALYAMKSRESGGRQHREDTHPTRTCYQRDRDRIVHCEAFRKLEYKTQVFVIFEGDYYRTRLTHTLEVSQIGRTIGRNLRLNEDLIEAVALAHDLGHPPFGHAGEEKLNELMQDRVGRGFNHNKRSFEIVTELEKRYPDFDGLNLTIEVLVGILKHQTAYDFPGIKEEFNKEEPTLEARVVDIADSLAYLNHDIDDGITSGCITEEDLRENELWQKALRTIEGRIRSSNRDMVKYQIVKQLIDMQVKDLLAASDGRLQEHKFLSSAQARQCQEHVIGFSEETARQRDHLQNLLNERLYHHYRVERMTSKAKRIIEDLFRVYDDNPKQLPPASFQRINEGIDKYEVICNYIASMTDRFALDEHRRFFNPYEKV